MNSAHKVNVVRIEEILPHTNADSLGIVYIGGYQCVVKKEVYKVGDLALYIQPDTLVPVHPAFSFLWEGTEPTERRRRVTVRRFRKEWSEGLLMPVSEFDALHRLGSGLGCRLLNVSEGDDVAELLGFKHYEEPEHGAPLGTPGRTLPLWQRILKFFGYKPRPFGPKVSTVYDVESLKNYPRVFAEGEEVIVTEKIHGSNARYLFDGKKFWIGSHKKWRKDSGNIWARIAAKYPWIEQFCRDNPGDTLYGEVTPTQAGYQYGNTPEEQFFAFDVKRADGSYIPKRTLYKLVSIQQLVPVVYEGPYDAAKVKAMAEGRTLVGMKNAHIREGIVVSSVEERTVRGVGRAHLKLKSMAFLEEETK
jgi:RNA ligase (TIGR02306 family)